MVMFSSNGWFTIFVPRVFLPISVTLAFISSQLNPTWLDSIGSEACVTIPPERLKSAKVGFVNVIYILFLIFVPSDTLLLIVVLNSIQATLFFEN